MDVRPCPVIFATGNREPLLRTCMAGEKQAAFHNTNPLLLTIPWGERCDGNAHKVQKMHGKASRS